MRGGEIVRLCCEYRTGKIPVAYKMMFVSLIKEALKSVDEDYFQKLYKYEDKNNKQIKNFCFSVALKDYKFDNQVILINDKMIFNISTSDYEFGIKIYNGLLGLDTFKYKEYKLEKIKIHLKKEKFIGHNDVVFKTMSPICIKDKSNAFISPNDTNFNSELNYIIDKILTSNRGYGLKSKLNFIPIDMKKVVVKEEIRAFEEKTNKKVFYVNAYSGIFRLSGNLEDLNEIYQTGIGFRRGQGFGMIDLF